MSQERRLATMLFADIVGSTGFTGSREPEVVRLELGRAFERIRAILVEHGGTVEKFIGDAVMCVFGVPVAHDNDAERALRAAVAMRDEFERRGGGLRLRIGINTGEVVAGDAAAGEPLVTGRGVIAAARLQESATPGEILAGPLTRRLTAEAAHFGETRTLAAKNMDIDGSAVLALTDAMPGDARRGGPRAPFIGRDEELDVLRSVLRRTARERRGHIVTIFGQAGVGKTRLVTEFVTALEVQAMRGRCLPYGRSITFWPLREMLSRASGIEPTDSPAEAYARLRTLVDPIPGPTLEEREGLLHALAGAIGLAEAGDRYPTLDEIVSAIGRFLEHRAQNEPLVVVIEDIHWAETAFLDLIEQLSARVRAPLLLVCVSRPELFERRPAWGAGRTSTTALTLEPLTREESLVLARELLRLAALGEDLATGIVERTEGNPLYVEEVVRTLTEGDAPGQVPATLQGIITARLDRLPPPVRLMLRRASVQGRDFSAETLNALGDDAGDRASRLGVAIERDFIAERERGPEGARSYRFRHVIIRDVVYGTIAKTDRWQLHLRLAEWLGGRADPDGDVAAYHLEQAYRLANDVNAPEAVDVGRRAFVALSEAATRARQHQDFAAALDLYERTRPIGERVGVDRAALLEVEGFGAIQRLRLEPTPDAIAALDRTLETVRAAGPSVLLARLLTWRITLSRPTLSEMRALLTELVAVARASGDSELVAQSLWFSHEPYWLAGDLEADRRILEEALAYAKEHHAVFAHLSSLSDLASNALDRGDLAAALAYLKDAQGPSQTRGMSLDRFKVLAMQCEAALATGDLTRGHELARDARHLARAIGGPWPAVRSADLLSDALRASGDRAAARAVLAEELPALEGQRAPGQDTLPHLLWRLARLEIETGALDDAARHLAALREQRSPDVRIAARGRALEARLAAARGSLADGDRGLRDAVAMLDATECTSLRAEIEGELGAPRTAS